MLLSDLRADVGTELGVTLNLADVLGKECFPDFAQSLPHSRSAYGFDNVHPGKTQPRPVDPIPLRDMYVATTCPVRLRRRSAAHRSDFASMVDTSKSKLDMRKQCDFASSTRSMRLMIDDPSALQPMRCGSYRILQDRLSSKVAMILN